MVRTDDAMVSRKNCKISLQAGRWMVEDLGSANGTFITTGNNAERRIQKDGLQHGDVVRVGSLQVRFVEVPDAPVQVHRPSVPLQPPAQAQGATQGQGPSQAMSRPPSQPVDSDEVRVAAKEAGADKAQESGAKLVSASDLAKHQEEVKKLEKDMETAQKAAQEAQAEREQAVGKLEAQEGELKRLRTELGVAKESMERVTRSAKKDKDELTAEQRVNEELRHDLKTLREQHTKTLTSLEEIKAAAENKDRQLANVADDVRRAKKEQEALTTQLNKLVRERDEQVRNINTERGDTDSLRAILKERVKLIDEQRVGIVNQEATIKDLKKQLDESEQNLTKTKSERDSLRERMTKLQSQGEDVKAELDRVRQMVGQQGGEQVLELSTENRNLRRDLDVARDELEKLREQAQKTQTELVELSRQSQKLSEDRKQSGQRTQQAVEQAVEQALSELRAKHTLEIEKVSGELTFVRTSLASAEADLAAHAEKGKENAARTDEQERALREELVQAKQAKQQWEAELSQSKQSIDALTQALAEKNAALEAAAKAVPAAGGGNAAAAEQALLELKAVATSAYDGIADAFGSLRRNLVDLEEGFHKVSRLLTDKEASQRLRKSLEEVMMSFDEARSQIRSLAAVLD
jgi:chromosome segregation ATPase